ncbi:MAG: hypothetical protein ABIO05_07285 [Ferruginibacter sp.]
MPAGKNNTTDTNNTENDVTPEERSLLDESIENSLTGDSENLRRSALDNMDEDGELLNEGSMADDLSGEDLDVPGSEADDDAEAIGNEDEENNAYSDADTD